MSSDKTFTAYSVRNPFAINGSAVTATLPGRQTDTPTGRGVSRFRLMPLTVDGSRIPIKPHAFNGSEWGSLGYRFIPPSTPNFEIETSLDTELKETGLKVPTTVLLVPDSHTAVVFREQDLLDVVTNSEATDVGSRLAAALGVSDDHEQLMQSVAKVTCHDCTPTFLADTDLPGFPTSSSRHVQYHCS